MALLAAMDDAVKEVEASRHTEEAVTTVEAFTSSVVLCQLQEGRNASSSGNNTTCVSGAMGQATIEEEVDSDESDEGEGDGEIEYGEGFKPPPNASSSGHGRKVSRRKPCANCLSLF